jgi:dihydropteroate synthase
VAKSARLIAAFLAGLKSRRFKAVLNRSFAQQIVSFFGKRWRGQRSILAGMIFWTRTRFEWRLRTRSLHLGERTCVMAVVPLAREGPRSSTGLDAAWAKVSIAVAVEAVDAGADVIDLGTGVAAESAHSHSAPASAEQEQARLFPVLEGVLNLRPKAVVSVDVYHAQTAQAAARLGAEIVNDACAPGWDAAMAEVIARTGCGLVLRHTRGRSREWLAEGPMSSDEVVPSVFSGLCERLAMAEAAGIDTDQIIADPGFSAGFGLRKPGAEDLTLLAGLGRLRQLGRPLVVGFPAQYGGSHGVEKVSGSEPDGQAAKEAHRAAVIAGNVTAILAGVHLLRVQDVQAAREAAAVADAVLSCGARADSIRV